MPNHQDLLDIFSLTETLNIHYSLDTYIKETREGFEIRTGTRRHNQEIYRAFNAAHQYLEFNRDIDVADPDVRTFIQLVNELNHRSPFTLIYTEESSAHNACDDINWVIHRYQEMKGKDSKLRRNRKRTKSRNTESLKRYCDNIFDVHSRILVVRMDFGYRSHVYKQLCTHAVIQDRCTFLDKVKHKYPGLVGYVWKLEYGEIRTFHYHMVFLFDGSLHHSDIRLGKALGELWEDNCHTYGTHHNCNADRNYTECYLGMVHHLDDTKRQVMTKHLPYLCKEDRIIGVFLKKRQRCFGRMETPRRSSNAGRPRRQPGPLIE